MMKFCFLILFIPMLFFSQYKAFSFTVIPTVQLKTGTTLSVKNTITKNSSYKKNKKRLETNLGRKLKLSEKIGLRFYSWLPDYDNELQKKANNQALTGFILGVCSLVIFPLAAIPGFIFSNAALTKEKMYPGILEGSNKGLAKAGKIISIIGFVYLLLIVAYIILVLSTAFYFY